MPCTVAGIANESKDDQHGGWEPSASKESHARAVSSALTRATNSLLFDVAQLRSEAASMIVPRAIMDGEVFLFEQALMNFRRDCVAGGGALMDRYA